MGFEAKVCAARESAGQRWLNQADHTCHESILAMLGARQEPQPFIAAAQQCASQSQAGISDAEEGMLACLIQASSQLCG